MPRSICRTGTRSRCCGRVWTCEAEIARWAREDPDGLRNGFDADDLYPDVRPALTALREAGFDVVIAGNQPPEARAALEAMDLPASAIRTSDEWGVQKPEPEFFARVAELSGVAPEEIAYVGDRLDNDVLPAADAGMRPDPAAPRPVGLPPRAPAGGGARDGHRLAGRAA